MYDLITIKVDDSLYDAKHGDGCHGCALVTNAVPCPIVWDSNLVTDIACLGDNRSDGISIVWVKRHA